MSGIGSTRIAELAMLALAAAGWYVTSRVAEQVLAGPHGAGAEAGAGAGAAPASGRRALGHWLATAIVAIGAVIAGMPQVAVGVVFGTSVAALTLVLGICTIAARHTAPSTPRRMWAFVLPVALIVLMVGFSGGLSWIHVAILGLEGVALASLWSHSTGPAAETGSPPTRVIPAEPAGARARGGAFVASLLLVVALLAGAVSAWAGLVAARDLSNRLMLPGPGLVASVMLSPALVLAMIGSGSVLASEGRFDEVVQAKVGFVLLNLLALLPLTTVLWLTRPHWHPAVHRVYASVTQFPATQPASTTAPATTQSDVTSDQQLQQQQQQQQRTLPFPMGVWRIDTVILIAIGLLLLPVALGRWSLGMSEGYGLIIAYSIYMVMTTLLAR